MQHTSGSFLETFLKSQGLKDCTITFEPYHAKKVRRAKRSNTLLKNSLDPKSAKRLSDKDTVDDLMNTLLSLSVDMYDWTVEEGKRYKPRIGDDEGNEVGPETPLGELRGRAEARQRDMLEEVERLLSTALRDCDRLAEQNQVNKILKTLLAARRNEAA